MKTSFPINNDRDYYVVAKIIAPDLFNMDYVSCLKARELYNSLTEDDKNEIKNFIESTTKS